MKQQPRARGPEAPTGRTRAPLCPPGLLGPRGLVLVLGPGQGAPRAARGPWPRAAGGHPRPGS